MNVIHTLILIFHVLGAAIIIGTSFVSVYILFRNRIPRDNLRLVDNIWKLVVPTIGVQILTGFYLAGSEWVEFGRNPILWIKIALVVINGVIGTLLLGKYVRLGLTTKEKEIYLPVAARWAWISLLIFSLIATLGVIMVESQA